MKTQITLSFSFLVLILFVLPTTSVAQQGTTVQLPAFQTQRVDTTVLVPDGGSAFLGGITRTNLGKTSRGVPFVSGIPGLNRLFRNQAIGSEYSNSNTRAHVRIISLEEMDKAVLAEAAHRRSLRDSFAESMSVPKPAAVTAAQKKAAFISRHIGRNSNSSNSNR